MKIITIIIILLVSNYSNAGALIHPTIMKVEYSGLIGEKGALESVPYKLLIEFADKASVWPSNKQQISKLSALVDNSEMVISNNLYSDLIEVGISDIRISYLQFWGEKSSVEVFIPHGKSQPCENHEDNSTYYRQSKRILVFSVDGRYIKTKNKSACQSEH
jgi:hypothetical protein